MTDQPQPHIGAGDKDALLTAAGIERAEVELAWVEKYLPIYATHDPVMVPYMEARQRGLKKWLEENSAPPAPTP
jgi:hypothetical protein